jgi:hypothetical protein
LHRYVDEFEIRWNYHRKTSDGARMLAAGA